MLIDAHTHLDMMGSDWETTLTQIENLQIFSLSVSTDIPTYQTAKTLAEKYPFMAALFGIHPWHVGKVGNNFAQLDPFIAESPILGEIGLDYYFFKEQAVRRQQSKLFDYFLAAAESQQKLVNLHATGAEEAVLRRLEGVNLPGAIMHWYAGPLKLIERFLAAGAYFSIGVGVLFSDHIRDVLAAIPANRLLTETDNPDAHKVFAPSPGYPAVLQDIVLEISRLRGWTETETKARVATNFTHCLHAAPTVKARWQVFSGEKDHADD